MLKYKRIHRSDNLMPKKITRLIVIIYLAAAINGFIFLFSKISEAAQINATIKISVCGNGVVESGEQCDGADLGGKTCSNYVGFNGGTLGCLPSCQANTSQCTYTAPSLPPASSSGGGGGGGGGFLPTVPVQSPVLTSVIISGAAYPSYDITILKDGQVASVSPSGPDAHFDVTVTDVSAGHHDFSVYSEDAAGRRSTLFTFPVYITQGTTTRISGIVIAPTIAVDKSQVKRGDNIAVFGQTHPQGNVTIQINSENELFQTTKADEKGYYLKNIDTALLEKGEHYTKSKVAVADDLSSFSQAVKFTVGDENKVFEEEPKKGDANNDGKVNLVDFSVEAYWYKRPSPPAECDLNKDGKIDLIDLSIMAYNWTG